MTKTLIFQFLRIAITFGYLTIQRTSAEGSTLTSTMILSYCSNNEPSPATIPNLSFAKSIINFPAQNFTCNMPGNLLTADGHEQNITWYYYNDYSKTKAESCSQDSTDSTMSFSYIAYQSTKDNVINYRNGIISAGAFINQNVTIKIITPNKSYKKCDTSNPLELGLEIIIANVEFDIVDGPSCTGVVISEYCPGIHSVKRHNVMYKIHW